MRRPPPRLVWPAGLFLGGLLLGFLLRGAVPTPPPRPAPVVAPSIPATTADALRPAPDKPITKDHHWPADRESAVCGGIRLDDFSAGRDLVYVDDPTVWWESDQDAKENDTEDDHSMNVALEPAFRRLVALLAREKPDLQLRVQECFRAAGVHSARSLHAEGRALDVTVGRKDGSRLPTAETEAAYSELASFCWQAGFDWVFFENATGTGPHIHASVKRAEPGKDTP